MFFYDLLFILVFHLLLLTMVIRYKLNEINEKNIINTVLSKLDFYPNHYKIIKKDNKIYIKCHYYTLDCSQYIISNYNINYIQYNSNGYYIKVYGNHELKTKILNNYAPGKDIGIITIDILIDLKEKYYKIITTYFQIITCNYYLNEDLHSKIINYLDDPSFYINISNIYDNNLNINNNIPNYYFEPFYQNLANKEKRFRCNYIKPFNIIITDGTETLILKPIITQIGEHPNTIMKVSEDIDIEPHINNHISINKITGLLL